MIRCYSIFDRKALVYFPPFFQSTDGAAVRSLSDLVSDAQSTVSRHPNDYVLYMIGEYDDQKGALIPCAPLVHIIDAVALVPHEPSLPLIVPPGGAPASTSTPSHHRPNGSDR